MQAGVYGPVQLTAYNQSHLTGLIERICLVCITRNAVC